MPDLYDDGCAPLAMGRHRSSPYRAHDDSNGHILLGRHRSSPAGAHELGSHLLTSVDKPKQSNSHKAPLTLGRHRSGPARAHFGSQQLDFSGKPDQPTSLKTAFAFGRHRSGPAHAASSGTSEQPTSLKIPSTLGRHRSGPARAASSGKTDQPSSLKTPFALTRHCSSPARGHGFDSHLLTSIGKPKQSNSHESAAGLIFVGCVDQKNGTPVEPRAVLYDARDAEDTMRDNENGSGTEYDDAGCKAQAMASADDSVRIMDTISEPIDNEGKLKTKEREEIVSQEENELALETNKPEEKEAKPVDKEEAPGKKEVKAEMSIEDGVEMNQFTITESKAKLNSAKPCENKVGQTKAEKSSGDVGKKKQFGLKMSQKPGTFSSNFTKSELPKMKPASWPHTSVFVQAGSNTKVIGMSNDQPVPLGVPFEIDSPLFKGKMLLRFRNIKSDDPESHSRYFKGRRRLMQTVIQGRFKQSVNMSEVYTGSIFAQPLAAAPPPRMAKIMNAVLGRIAPGLIMDLSSESPKVIALLAGAAQTMSIDSPGNEPDITLPGLEENVASVLGKNVATKSKRRKHLGNPKNAASYEFNTESVYTFHTYDDTMDYARGTMRLPLYGDYDIKPSIGRQPLSLTAVTQSGEILYDLRVWHESHHQD
eukprot:CAMPEP_0172329514 /NCGR_PEP_ID=MMETSP1058-20130122/60923_1 /TAXON_ID=83371 /ORGANISM="Detonula confervacea, Strain CCMP 353" /LENGTH=647 /DNA_ID=CAMNT_0013046693 /DNA_START=75 /DNA_END=2018 /DNA_ORIENTATION=+